MAEVRGVVNLALNLLSIRPPQPNTNHPCAERHHEGLQRNILWFRCSQSLSFRIPL